MGKEKKNILISGLPGIGKTTLIKEIYAQIKDSHPVGFYTEEIRNESQRKGFQLMGLDGSTAIFAHILIESPHHVGKYRVDVEAFDRFLTSFDFSNKKRPVIIDEIGKMECLSSKFVSLVSQVFDSDNLVIATISHTDGGIKGKIKQRDDVELFKMNLDNRNSLSKEILEVINTYSLAQQ
ncbi:MAG: NTPase [Thermodesulfobacteriota bacterium]